MRRVGIDRTLWPAIAALVLTFLLFEITRLDLSIQDRLYDFSTQRWMIDAQAALPRAVFYTGPKAILIALGVALLLLALGPQTWRKRLRMPEPKRKNLLVAFLTLGSVPAFVGGLKSVTNVFCPSEIRNYGGSAPYVRVLERTTENTPSGQRGHCFPAGHASGGFALLGLVGLARTTRGRALLVLLGLGAGTFMGAYQMAKGAHFLSHTVVTALIAWIFVLLWRRILSVAPPAGITEGRS